MDKSKRKLRGFTLMELIIVMAIIAILAAILVPSITGYIRTNRILTANDQAHQVYMAAQDYLTSEQIRGTKASEIMPASSSNKLCVIAVRTDIGSDSSQKDKKNKTTILDSYNISDDFKSKTDSGVTSFRIADGIESRLETGFSGSWVVAFYPKTFTVAYAVYNDFYKDTSERDAAVKFIGTNNGSTSDSTMDDRLYTHLFNGASSTKLAQESDFIHPDSSETDHLYAGQYPVPGPDIK